MTLQNFETNQSTTSPQIFQVVDEVAGAAVAEASAMVIAPIASSTHLTKPADVWEWRELRDYVVGQIEQRFGAQPHPHPEREASIFKSFLARWPEQAVDIAHHSFDVCDGWWGGAPISVNRFCKASDQFFGAPIAQRLTEVQERSTP